MQQQKLDGSGVIYRWIVMFADRQTFTWAETAEAAALKVADRRSRPTVIDVLPYSEEDAARDFTANLKRMFGS